MKKLKPGLMAGITLMLFALSCNSPDIYNQYKSVEKQGWYKEDTISFTPTVPDTSRQYNLIINLRHTTDYKYRNVYFFTTTHFPNGDINRDTIELRVAKKSGEWIGKGFGTIKTYRQMLLRGIRFDQKGDYVFEFCQAMREDTLRGIEDIGLQIQKFDN
ncbi:MAG: gliding motility lipoprotein GldH [Bacteroidales bacterium]|nr:gliding motility lipoprotein GldH [Bacteroidales bacterium]MCF8338650.1 gliding motility lipoprotein GldH [Bacteroidales bacterium]